jgi:hypothetical protein
MCDESGQAAIEAAVLFAALAAVALLALPLVRAWEAHQSAVRAVVNLPLP